MASYPYYVEYTRATGKPELIGTVERVEFKSSGKVQTSSGRMCPVFYTYLGFNVLRDGIPVDVTEELQGDGGPEDKDEYRIDFAVYKPRATRQSVMDTLTQNGWITSIKPEKPKPAEPQYYNVTLKKVDSETREGLAGAQFRITGPENTNFETLVTKSSGKLQLYSLRKGTNFYEEIKTPDGYEPIIGKIPFELPRDLNLEIPNTKKNVPPPPPPPPPPPEKDPTKHWIQYYDVFYKQHIVYQYDSFEIAGKYIVLKEPFIKWVDGKKTHTQEERLTYQRFIPSYIINGASDEPEIDKLLKSYEAPNQFNKFLSEINKHCKDYVGKYGLESLLDGLVILKEKVWGEVTGFRLLAYRGSIDTDIKYVYPDTVKENITEFYCGPIDIITTYGMFSFNYLNTEYTGKPTSQFNERLRKGTIDESWFCWQGKFELVEGFVGRRKLDEPLDRIIEIMEYYIPSLAYEPAIEPNRCGDLQETEIALLKCPELSPACNDTYMFAGPQIQYQYYMQKKQPLKYNNYSYVRKDNTVNIEEHVDNIRGYNYCIYKNKGKYFYAFIMKKEYVNERTTRLYLATDVIQTFLFDFELEDSMVDRCHVDRWQRYAPNQPTREIEPEGLEFGENRLVNGPEGKYVVAQYKDTFIAVCSNPLGWLPSRHKAEPKPEEGGQKNE